VNAGRSNLLSFEQPHNLGFKGAAGALLRNHEDGSLSCFRIVSVGAQAKDFKGDTAVIEALGAVRITRNNEAREANLSMRQERGF
jgi:hypothetical protein